MNDLTDDNKKTYSKENLVKVETSQLQVGMFVAELDRPGLETPFLMQGFEIRQRSQVAKVAQHCDYVYVLREGTPRKKEAPQKFSAGLPPPAPRRNAGTLVAQVGRKTPKRKSVVRSRPAYINVKPAREEHSTARATHKKGASAVKKLMHSAQIGQMLNTFIYNFIT